MTNLRVTVKVSSVYTRIVTSVDLSITAPWDFYYIYICIDLYCMLQGALLRDVTLLLLSLLQGKFSPEALVRDNAQFFHLTRRTGRIRLWTLWPGEKISHTLGKCSSCQAVIQNEGTDPSPLHPVTDGLWAADISLGFAVPSCGVQIPPWCPRTVLHQVMWMVTHDSCCFEAKQIKCRREQNSLWKPLFIPMNTS